MKRITLILTLLCAVVGLAAPASARATNSGPPDLAKLAADTSEESRACIACHEKTATPAVVQQWAGSRHAAEGVGCYECHQADKADADALRAQRLRHRDDRHARRTADQCHEQETKEFEASHHAKAGEILGSLDNVLGEVVEGVPGGQQRLQAVPRRDGEGPGRREARRRHLAQHRHRPDQPGRLARQLLRLPQPPHLLRLHRPPAGELRQVPPGPRPPAGGDLHREQARHRLPRQDRRDEPGLQELGARQGLQRRAHLRHLPHERHPGPAGHPRRRRAHLLDPAARGLHQAGELGGAPRRHAEGLRQLPRAATGWATSTSSTTRRWTSTTTSSPTPAKAVMKKLRDAGKLTPTPFDEKHRVDLLRAVAPRGPPGPHGRRHDGPGLHPVARLLRGRQALLHGVPAGGGGAAARRRRPSAKAMDDHKWLQGLSKEDREKIQQYYQKRYGK